MTDQLSPHTSWGWQNWKLHCLALMLVKAPGLKYLWCVASQFASQFIKLQKNVIIKSIQNSFLPHWLYAASASVPPLLHCHPLKAEQCRRAPVIVSVLGRCYSVVVHFSAIYILLRQSLSEPGHIISLSEKSNWFMVSFPAMNSANHLSRLIPMLTATLRWRRWGGAPFDEQFTFLNIICHRSNAASLSYHPANWCRCFDR